jgi:hypothetical protein
MGLHDPLNKEVDHSSRLVPVNDPARAPAQALLGITARDRARRESMLREAFNPQILRIDPNTA